MDFQEWRCGIKDQVGCRDGTTREEQVPVLEPLRALSEVALRLALPPLRVEKLAAVWSLGEVGRTGERLELASGCAIENAFPRQEAIGHLDSFTASQFAKSFALGRFSIAEIRASARV